MIQPMQDDTQNMQQVIARDLGIADLPSDQQQALISQFGEVALKAATVSVLEAMPADKRDEFGKLTEGGDPGAVKSFLDAAVPNHEQIAKDAVTAEIAKFKDFQTAGGAL